ncbi:MAG: DUF3823 domain-containing protein [Flavobacterium sp.]
MDRFIKIFILVFFATFVSSCELDNLDGPTAGLYGRIIDEKNGELVPQDIVQGTIIELREFGYANVAPQNLVVKNNGTYENSRLFENTYAVIPVMPNFQLLPTQDVLIKGRTNLDFTVKPFVRILESKIEKIGTQIVATFKLEQTTIDPIMRISLFSHRDPNVGAFVQTGKTDITLNAVSVPNQVYTVAIETANNTSFVAGKTYYFRVGAITTVPLTRANYAPTVVAIAL